MDPSNPVRSRSGISLRQAIATMAGHPGASNDEVVRVVDKLMTAHHEKSFA